MKNRFIVVKSLNEELAKIPTVDHYMGQAVLKLAQVFADKEYTLVKSDENYSEYIAEDHTEDEVRKGYTEFESLILNANQALVADLKAQGHDISDGTQAATIQLVIDISADEAITAIGMGGKPLNTALFTNNVASA